MSGLSKKRGQRQQGDDEGGEESASKRASRRLSPTPPPPLSPAQRCHPDHLSHAFVFLTSPEMAAAIGACRSWYAAGGRHSAWPPFDVARLISALLHNPRYTPSCVDVALKPVEGNGSSESDAAVAELTQILASRVWSQTRELRVRFPPRAPLPTPIEDRTLGLIAQLPRLQSLELCMYMTTQSPAASHESFTALAPRLLRFRSTSHGMFLSREVSLLSHLRVLELRHAINPVTLRSLHELEYLSLDHAFTGPGLCLAVRELSVQHRLRYLSVEGRINVAFQDLRALALQSFASDELQPAANPEEEEEEEGPEEITETNLPPANLTFIRVDLIFTLSSLYAVLSLPKLETLKMEAPNAFEGYRRQPELPEPPLHESQRLPVVSPSPVRTLLAPLTKGDQNFAAVVLRAPNIETLTLQSMEPEGWAAMDQLQSLRELILLAEQPFPSSANFEILTGLPYFRRLTLGVAVERQGEGMMTLAHLQALSHSRSWDCVEITSPNSEWIDRGRIVTLPPSFVDADVQQLQCLHVHYRSSEVAKKVHFQLQPTGGGDGREMKWIVADP